MAHGRPDNSAHETELVLAVAASFTAEPFVPTIRFWAERLGWSRSLVQVAGYGQILQSLLAPDSLLAGSKAGANLVLLRLEDFGRSLPPDKRLDAIVQGTQQFLTAASEFSTRARRPTIVVLCQASPAARADQTVADTLGNLEQSIDATLSSLPGWTVVRSEDIADAYAVADVHDPHGDTLGHIPYTLDYYAALSTVVMRRVRSVLQPPCKVVVLDADNTLWDGVVGEIGADAVNVGARLALQSRMRQLRSEGVLLALVSKNHEDDVAAVFARADMLLRPEDFVAWKVNWLPKSQNIRALVDELGLGMSSVLFIDDNPAECAEVAGGCPGVSVLTLPADGIADFLRHVWAFDLPPATQADRDRTEQYRQQFSREREREAAGSYKAFLESLALEVRVVALQPEFFDRASQLTQRTNQFNITAVRWTVADLSARVSSGECSALLVFVSDRFGDYGAVGLAAYHVTSGALRIEQFLLSCRVLGKGVEHQLLAGLGAIACEAGLSDVVLPLTVTSRNEPAQRFLTSLGVARRQRDDFVIAAESARDVHFEPESYTAAPVEGQDSTPRAEAVAVLIDFETIATTLNTGARIAAMVAASGPRSVAREPATSRMPATPEEAAMLQIWRSVLRQDALGVDDDFFDHGGDSVLAIQVLSRAARHGWAFSLRDLFDRPTVAALLSVDPASQTRTAPAQAPSVPDEGETDRLSLSPLQQGIVIQSLQLAGSGVGIEQDTCTLRGAIDADRFAAACRRVITRYAALRTTFEWEGLPEPVQIVHADGLLAFEAMDWRAVAPDLKPLQLEAYLRRERLRGFQLAQLPLVRLALIQTNDHEFTLVWTYHHAILDGWSVPIVLREIFATCAGQVPSGAVPSFTHYLSWLGRQDNDAAERYWRRKLAGFTSPTPLATSRRGDGGGALSDDTWRRELVVVDPATGRAIQDFARTNRLTISTLLNAAWALLLSRYSSADDVVFGCTIAGRPVDLPDVDAMVGVFINTLPLRVQVRPEATILSWLKGIQDSVLELDGVQASALMAVQRWSEVPAGRPLFESLVVVQNFPPLIAGDAAADISIEYDPSDRHSKTGYPLTLLATLDPELRLQLWYDSRLFAPDRVDALCQHLVTLLSGIVADAHAPLSTVGMLSRGERRLLLTDLNRTAADVPASTCLHDMVDRQATATPDATAVVYGTDAWTYRELNDRANQLAHRLVSLGAGPDVPVAVLMERSPWLVAALLGILKSGAAYVPLDARYPRERLSAILDDAAPSVVVTDAAHVALLPAGGRRVLVIDDEWSSIAALPSVAPATSVTPAHLAYILFTSGSTGRPKGVAIEHRAAVNFVTWGCRTFSAAELRGVLFATSVCFDLSVFELFVTLASGGTVVIASSIMDLDAIPARSQVTLLNTVPSAMAELVRAGVVPPSVTTVNLAGEALSDPLVESIYATGTVARVNNLYGPTETTTYSTWTPVARGSRVTIGRPVDNTQVYILDAAGQLAPFGVAGELFIGGDGLARGYYGRPDLTADRFVVRDLGDGVARRLYRTGDRCAWRGDRTLEYQGRFDHQVKVRGFRIELGEIEASIHRHPGVAGAVVIVREDTPGDQQIVAYVVADCTADDLRAHVRGQLPEYMVPAHFVAIDHLPLTPNGKIDRKALPPPSAPVSRSTMALPTTDLERRIAEIWCEVLALPQVGIRDNFFEAGGNSLKLMRVHHQLQQRCGITTPIVTLFSHPTIEALAARVSTGSDAVMVPEAAADQSARDRAARQRAAAERMRTSGSRRGR